VSICSGSSTSLGASGGVSYSWSPSTGLSATNVANPTASHTSTTTYTVTATDGNGCTGTDDVVVTVQAQPDAGTISGTNNTNIGATTSLSSDGDSGGSWSSSDDNIATVNSSGVVSGVAAGSVTITYTVSATSPCTSDATDTYAVTINSSTISTTPFKSAKISLVGRNLGFLKNDSDIDPEAIHGVGATNDGYEAFSLPNTRSIGLNLKLGF